MTQTKKMLIVGNGPSTLELADYGLENLRPDIDTFGMGIAYRYFRQVNWWPTYYACGDSKVVFSHREALKNIVEDPAVTTERFYFSWSVSQNPRFERIHHCSTGDFCLRKTLELRYEEIYVIGIEGHYVEELLESRPLSDDEYHELGLDQLNLHAQLRKTLRIISRTPEHNPNYFFDGYQQKGDVYSLPQSHIHRNRWKEAAEVVDSVGARVLNLSDTSRIGDFPKSTLTNVGERIFDLPEPNTEAEIQPNQTSVAKQSPAARAAFWWGPFDRELKIKVDETRAVLDLFQSAPPVNPNPTMIDVGACKGGAFSEFAEQDWTVHAFEPNPPLFDRLVDNFGRQNNVTLNHLAVSNVEGEQIPFYTSDESIGISSLKPFRDTHQVTAHVNTVTLDNYVAQQELNRIEFLKIDTEGFDLMVLKGLDLVRHAVDVVVCEFEDRKTKPLGYTTQDMAEHLRTHGYTIYVSEWHPIVRYGQAHQFRALKLFPCELEEPDAWGNLVAFKTDPGIFKVASAINASSKPRPKQIVMKRNVNRMSLRSIKRILEKPLELAAKTAIRQLRGKRDQGKGNNKSDRSRNAA